MDTMEKAVTAKVPTAERYEPASIKPGLRFYIRFVGNADGRKVFVIYQDAERYILVLSAGASVGPKTNEDLLCSTLFEIVSKQAGEGVQFVVESYDGNESSESPLFEADAYGRTGEFVELPDNTAMPITALEPLSEKTHVVMKDDAGKYLLHVIPNNIADGMDFIELDAAGQNPHQYQFLVVSEGGYRSPKIARRA